MEQHIDVKFINHNIEILKTLLENNIRTIMVFHMNGMIGENIEGNVNL